ncbi:MAG: CDP-alcohol phosphatidyltransferase family protein [Pirellulales bacterium]
MLDRPVRRLIDPWLEYPAKLLFRCGVSATAITGTGFVVGMLGCAALAWRYYAIALVCVLLNRLADGLDGMVARRKGSTDAGGFLDIVLDTIFYSAVPLGFAVGEPQVLLPAIFLVQSFMGTTSSFLAFAIVSAKRGVTAGWGGAKSFYYHVGLMEGTETVLFLTAFCLFPSRFALLAWTFGSLCWLTTAIRIITALLVFRTEEKSKN